MRIMNSLEYQEAAHKILSMKPTSSQKKEICTMIVDSCLQNKTYSEFYGLLALTFCQ